MKTGAASAVLLSLPLTTLAAPQISKRDKISSCGPTWMAGQDVHDVQGFESARTKFCKEANDKTVKPDAYLSMGTEIWINDGKDPASYGLPGYVFFEIRNKGKNDHKVVEKDCNDHYKELSSGDSKCYGGDDTSKGQNKDTKGGTWQIGDNEITYHALAERTPPAKDDGWNKLYTDGVLEPRKANKDGQPLDPWPLDFTKNVKPANCHSHNDYTRDIPVFEALAAGCISVEADVHEKDGKARLGHKEANSASRTLDAMYVGPLKAMLDANHAIYPSKPDQALTILIDFKTDGDKTWQPVKDALKPLREAGYLSTSKSGKFEEKKITIVASGEAPLDKIKDDDDKDIFYDAQVKDLTDDINDKNSNYASGEWGPAVGGDIGKVPDQVKAAKAKGLHVRYWGKVSEDKYQPLLDAGVDRINMDNLNLVPGLKWD